MSTLPLLLLSLFLLLSPFLSHSSSSPPSPSLCIIGSGIAGSSVAHFLRLYCPPSPSFHITIFERHGVVGGRMATVTLANDTFEAGASILHPKNYHARNYTSMLGLKAKKPPKSEDSTAFGIWDGQKFVFKSLGFRFGVRWLDAVVEFVDNVRLVWRYGLSLLKMESFVESTVNRFLKYYESFDTRPVFESVDQMLKWAGLYNMTQGTLQTELRDAGLSQRLIDELVTVITRINYGQSVSISGLAGAVSLAGSGGGLWSVEGGNWQMASGVVNHSDVSLHLHEEIESVSFRNEYYELNSTKGNSYACDVAVVATPLDELNIQFSPPISIPERKLQHTHATFVRGILNPAYFGLRDVSQIPVLVGTIEDANLPFSSISVLKKYDKKDVAYKIFSRKPMADSLLDQIFSVQRETIRIDWGAYPHYNAPEVFAPFILDGHHLYYVNAFENAASTMETSAVAAENIARLILSRYFPNVSLSSSHVRSVTVSSKDPDL